MRITLVDWVSDTDLRKVGRRAQYLALLAKNRGMRQEGDAVVFVNVAMDRFRMVVMAGGVPMVLLPPTASKHDLLLSIFLRVSMFLQGARGKAGLPSRDRISKGKQKVMNKVKARQRRQRRKQGR